MIRSPSFARHDRVVIAVILSAALSEMLLQAAYHRMSGGVGAYLNLALVWLALVVGPLIVGRWSSERFNVAVRRFAVVASFGWFGFEVLRRPMTHVLHPTWLPGWLHILGFVAMAGALLVGTVALPHSIWVRLRRALAVAAVAFVGSQPLVAWVRAPALQWPPLSEAASKPAPDKSITLFLLFDEMSASSAGPLVQAIRDQGLATVFQPIDTVGEHTIKAIPAMFIPSDFSQAKPCGPTAICSGSVVLDFSRIRASRPDVDVVGFYHPYCSIRGLRYCAQMALDLPSALDASRWRCAVLRRMVTIGGHVPEECNQTFLDVWQRFVHATIAAVWEAPAWERGGFVFAHIPLPHPPGPATGMSLKDAYAANLERTTDLVRQIIERARRGGTRDVSLVIFSDHPLRLSIWCNVFLYSDRYCAQMSTEHTRVPLIVASTRTLPDVRDVKTNGQIFDLARRLPP